MLHGPSCDTCIISKEHEREIMKTQNLNSLKVTLRMLNQKIENLHDIEADRADIDEVIHERTKIQWAIVAEIDKNN